MPDRFTTTVLDDLIDALSAIRQCAVSMATDYADDVRAADASHRASALNLLHYLGVRQHDIRPLQRQLAMLGLSSLGRIESHALAGIDAVLAALHRLADRTMVRTPEQQPPVDFHSGGQLLERNTRELLGELPINRSQRIMVTMPSEAAEDGQLVRDLVEAGMDVMRINTAHDGPEQWRAMAAHLREAERALGRTCRIQVDLQGPKLRTGALASTAQVLKFRPRRDLFGRVVDPALVWLTPVGHAEPKPDDADAELTIDDDLAAAARQGDVITLRDCRGRRRKLHVDAVRGRSCLAHVMRTCYVASGAALRLCRGGGEVAQGRVGDVPAVEEPILLRVGDTLVLTRDDAPGRAAGFGDAGQIIDPARIPCTLGEAFDDVRVGHRVWFDDGKIAGVVTRALERELHVRITQAKPAGSRLRSDKGINLPDSTLRLPSLTADDLRHLDTVIDFADIIGASFVRGPDDVEALHNELTRRDARRLGVIHKIETRQGFENLPQTLLAALRWPRTGVMVARGDLAIEIGFERLAEVQEEILWLCEAAHVPVVWATQVLENLAKSGSPSRAEVTDAAMSARAECVMLNKGPHVDSAVRFLAGVLERMQGHQHKKMAMLRRLSVSNLATRESAGAGILSV